METENDIREAQASKLRAETLKLELEAREIERRLSAPRWRGQNLEQYIVAIVITSAVLFGWTLLYLEPILRQETELNELYNATLDARNEKLIRGNKELSKDQAILKTANAKLEREKNRLISEGEALTKQKGGLERVVDGLNLAIEQLADENTGEKTDEETKFFSIWNSSDPIRELSKSYGWDTSFDDFYYPQLGMYLVIHHKQVRSDKEIFVGRIIEINKLKRDRPKDWQEDLRRITDDVPVLAVDYSYFGLLVDKSAPVGGTIYKQSGETLKFYAPLGEWTERLGDLLQAE